MTKRSACAQLTVLFLFVLPHALGQSLPAGSTLEVRLKQEVNSYSSRPGQEVEAVLIAPALAAGELLVPMGSLVRGHVKNVHRVGLGLGWETARLELVFEQLQLPDGASFPIKTKLIELQNARERVDASGHIQGIRATNTPGYRAGGLFGSLASVDPIALLFTSTAFASVLRFSEPEIRLTTGAELVLRLESPVPLAHAWPEEAPPLVATGDQRLALAGLLRRLPYKTTKLVDGTPSDLTNLVFLGTPDALERAFEAAGWVQADQATAATRYKALRAFAESQSYREAPMSTLLLDGQRALMNWSKTLNTFSRRHHLRIYETGEHLAGVPLLTAAATQDTGITMNIRQRLLTHRIDERIDNERAKVVNDLLFTGCVEGAELLRRPWVPTHEANGTGQQLETDGGVALLRLNNCSAPRRYDLGDSLDSGPYRGNQAVRVTRHALLILRNDVMRGNLIWQGATWAAQLQRMFRRTPARLYRPELRHTDVQWSNWPEGAWDPGDPLSPEPLAGGGGMDYIARTPASRSSRSASGPPSGPAYDNTPDRAIPSIELNFEVGPSLFSRSNGGPEGLILSKVSMPGAPTRRQLSLTAGNRISPGYAIGGSVTVHTDGKLSHELGFQYMRGTFSLGLLRLDGNGLETLPGVVEQKAGLLTSQFSYNTVYHFRSGEKTWRPYVAFGPALQLMHLTDAPFEKARGLFRFGLTNVGIVQAAYNFGSAPPLEGGGIFQLGAQFGGGLKARVGQHWVWRLDYRDTLSQRPDFLRKSLAQAVNEQDPAYDFRLDPLPTAKTRSWICQQRLSMGVSFVF